MTPKQERFVDEYLVDLNAKDAAIRAGYSERTAKQQGGRLMNVPAVAQAIAVKQRERSERTAINADSVLFELAKIGFANMADYVRVNDDGDAWVDLSGLTREQAAAIAEIVVEDFKDGRGEGARDVRRVKFKLSDKRAALVDIGRHLGMFIDNMNHTFDATGLAERVARARARSGLDGSRTEPSPNGPKRALADQVVERALAPSPVVEPAPDIEPEPEPAPETLQLAPNDPRRFAGGEPFEVGQHRTQRQRMDGYSRL